MRPPPNHLQQRSNDQAVASEKRGDGLGINNHEKGYFLDLNNIPD